MDYNCILLQVQSSWATATSSKTAQNPMWNMNFLSLLFSKSNLIEMHKQALQSNKKYNHRNVFDLVIQFQHETLPSHLIYPPKECTTLGPKNILSKIYILNGHRPRDSFSKSAILWQEASVNWITKQVAIKEEDYQTDSYPCLPGF